MRIEQKGENMKKLLLILPVMALAACSSEQPTTLVSGCEKITTDREGGDVYKCPMTEELAAIQAMEANAMFGGSGDTIDLKAIVADAENVYVNVFGTCEQEGQVAYRVMVKNPKIDGKTMWAVEVCK